MCMLSWAKSIKFSSEFYAFSPAISKWESSTRSIKNYVLARRQVETGMELIGEFLLANGANVDGEKVES